MQYNQYLVNFTQGDAYKIDRYCLHQNMKGSNYPVIDLLILMVAHLLS